MKELLCACYTSPIKNSIELFFILSFTPTTIQRDELWEPLEGNHVLKASKALETRCLKRPLCQQLHLLLLVRRRQAAPQPGAGETAAQVWLQRGVGWGAASWEPALQGPSDPEPPEYPLSFLATLLGGRIGFIQKLARGTATEDGFIAFIIPLFWQNISIHVHSLKIWI